MRCLQSRIVAYERQGASGAACASSARGRRAGRAPRRPGARRGRWAGTRPGRRAPAARRSRRSTAPMPGSAVSAPPPLAPGRAPGSRSTRPSSDRLGQRRGSSPRRAAGIPNALSGQREQLFRAGEAVGGDQAREHRAGRRHRDLLADDGPYRDLEAVDRARHPYPRLLLDRRGERGSAASVASTASGSASRSNSRRQRATAGARSRTSARRSVAATYPGCGVSSAVAVPCGRRSARRYVPSATSSTPAIARAARNSSSAAACSGARYAQPQRDRTPASGVRRRARRRAQRRRRDAVHLPDRVVELPHAAEPGRERDLREAEVGRLDEHPGGLGALRAGERERAGAELRRAASG